MSGVVKFIRKAGRIIPIQSLMKGSAKFANQSKRLAGHAKGYESKAKDLHKLADSIPLKNKAAHETRKFATRLEGRAMEARGLSKKAANAAKQAKLAKNTAKAGVGGAIAYGGYKYLKGKERGY